MGDGGSLRQSISFENQDARRMKKLGDLRGQRDPAGDTDAEPYGKERLNLSKKEPLRGKALDAQSPRNRLTFTAKLADAFPDRDGPVKDESPKEAAGRDPGGDAMINRL